MYLGFNGMDDSEKSKFPLRSSLSTLTNKQINAWFTLILIWFQIFNEDLKKRLIKACLKLFALVDAF